MARKLRIDMTGQRHGRLVALRFAHRDASGHAHWLFRCDCGREVVAHGGNVRRGNSLSCGCLHREASAARLTVHGHRAGRRHDPTYRAWQRMNDSCANPASPGWARCGARGIEAVESWRGDYPAFLGDMGERPPGTVLRRMDEARDFMPGNCRWEPRPSPASGSVGRQGPASAARHARPSERPAGWPDQPRAASSQSRSSPAAASIMRASIAR